ncbi:MAG: hypothetical protein RL693_672 [Verrucomicrobiota bacterium]
MDLSRCLLKPDLVMKIRLLTIALVPLLFAGCNHATRHEAEDTAPVEEEFVAIKRLSGTSWVLISLEGIPLASDTADAAPLSLDFSSDAKEVVGYSGVNRFAGRYDQDGDSLQFGPLALTRRIGPADRQELEARFTRILSGVSGWRQNGKTLQLMVAGKVGAILAPATSAK